LIVIQNRNDAVYLPTVLASIVHQPGVRVVGIDAGSTDASVGIYEKYPMVRQVPCAGLNQAAAVNRAIRSFWSDPWDTFTWINADDWFAHDFVEKHREQFALNPAIDVLGSEAWIFYAEEPDQPIRRWKAANQDLGARFAANMNYVCQPTVMVRRRVFETTGLIDESIVYPFDYEFWRRAWNWGFRFHVMPEATAWRRQLPGRFTQAKTREIRAEMQTIHERYRGGAKVRINPLETKS
jgi:GT2 family glycosyltransferase